VCQGAHRAKTIRRPWQGRAKPRRRSGRAHPVEKGAPANPGVVVSDFFPKARNLGVPLYLTKESLLWYTGK